MVWTNHSIQAIPSQDDPHGLPAVVADVVATVIDVAAVATEAAIAAAETVVGIVAATEPLCARKSLGKKLWPQLP